jgi:type II secretory pathway component GspD/PulD (secretin)
LEINLDDTNQLGINWEAGSENFKFVQSDFSNSKGNQSQGSLTIIGKEKQPFSEMNPNEYVKATLKLMGLDLDVTTLATPSIVANDSEGALIHIGRSIPYNETTTAGVNNTQTTSFKFLEVGTRLSFFPRLISNDDIINLRIKIEVSSSPGFVTFGKEGSIGKAPEKVSTTAQTTVNLKSGQRLIIGGLLSRSKTRETAGIPFLKDIPILKFFFSSASYQNETTETVIFLTTELVEGGKPLPERLQKRIRDVGTSEQKKDLSVPEQEED